MNNIPVLVVNALSTVFPDGNGGLQALQDVTFSVYEEQFVCVLGPSGCGKTTCALSIAKLLPKEGYIDGGEIFLDGKNLAELDSRVSKPELSVRGIHTFLHNPESERDWLYDPVFWQAYADDLARYRYNRFNLIYVLQDPPPIPIYTFLLSDLDQEFPEIKVKDRQPDERWPAGPASSTTSIA